MCRVLSRKAPYVLVRHMDTRAYMHVNYWFCQLCTTVIRISHDNKIASFLPNVGRNVGAVTHAPTNYAACEFNPDLTKVKPVTDGRIRQRVSGEVCPFG